MSFSTAASKQTLTEALRALQARGVGEHVFGDFRALDPAVILDTCRWYDEQKGRVTTGVLVEELRAGGRTPSKRRSVADGRREYDEQVVAWLREHFPDLDRPVWGPHPAALAAVFRLHRTCGKGALTVREHGPVIRAAVKAFDLKWAAPGPGEAAQSDSPRRGAPISGGANQGSGPAAPPSREEG